ncbi:MAG: hypothetical protein A7316_00315 [Candidatus Altiarchaeales archaeon WOR_SM1_86-2]|nr:MAG: hypothetical protein A7316_00315 [Candidatus Altiarchaeales archaeon WOR_SM1_86-2]ODS41310.1 MAG: hypothetical protein A7315_06620 [Candidatus Altiarchaeales archaeon WOR_SM1_79]
MKESKPLVKADNKAEKLEGYDELLYDIRSLLEKAKYHAYKAVDNIRVQTYWQIGERIVREELQHKERADYGKRVVERLAIDLGFKRRLMFDIVQFYKIYTIVHALRAQLSWTHYRALLKIKDKNEREFYENQTIQNAWSTRELEKQVKSGLYKKTLKKGKIVKVTPLPLKSVVPEEAFKNSYDFDFLALPERYSEKDIENGLLSKTEQLLLEFGTDFALLARQKPIIIDGEYHKVDLELYHRGIPCIILVDLKIGKFKADHVGQMNKYLNYYKENRKYEWELDPIGLIICEYKGEEEVHYALWG